MTSKPPVDLLMTPEELRGKGMEKWDNYPDDVLPCWVADTDFRPAPAITAALENVEGLGYPTRQGMTPERLVAKLFQERMEARYGWSANAAQTAVLTNVVQAVFAAIVGFSGKGDGVIVQTPNYPPFRRAVRDTGRAFIEWPARLDDSGYHWSFDDLPAEDVARAKVLVVCNPQNPTGRVMTRAELEALVEFAEAHDLLLLADEIHAELIYPGAVHIPLASLSPAAAAQTVTITSATKSFSIAGVHCAVMHFGTPELLERFKDVVPLELLGKPGIHGADATIAAWQEGGDWLEAMTAQLLENRDKVVAALKAKMPALTMQVPEATYLAWIDCRALRLNESATAFFLREAKVALSAGEAFDKDATGFVRLNFATSPAILEAILERMATAVRRLGG